MHCLRALKGEIKALSTKIFFKIFTYVTNFIQPQTSLGFNIEFEMETNRFCFIPNNSFINFRIGEMSLYSRLSVVEKEGKKF
jgi:hypothetical protein